MTQDIARFYELFRQLENGLGDLRTMRDCDGKLVWPRRGVYFFLDPKEPCDLSPGHSRVVRVGTHGLKAESHSTLWGRLRTHRGTRDGGGNHRASVFRRHVGEALMASGSVEVKVSTWNNPRPKSADALSQESILEKAVSSYIGRLKLLWLDVPDAPGPSSDRAYLELNAIALLSHASDVPSAHWLGHKSPNKAIRSSGLWNVSNAKGQLDSDFLSLLAQYIKYTVTQQIKSFCCGSTNTSYMQMLTGDTLLENGALARQTRSA